jgi:hypothetical protein
VPSLTESPRNERSIKTSQPLPGAPPWTLGLLLALPLSLLYLILAPPGADLAAATYRSDLFSRVGFTIWDNGWYSGHALPSYSLISPALGAWLGVRPLLALSAVAGAALFGVLATKAFPPTAARVATLSFAFGLCCELPSGRVPYDLGVALGLASLAVLAAPGSSGSPSPGHQPLGGEPPSAASLSPGRRSLSLLLALLTTVASPVAGAFLGLAGLAYALAALSASPRRAPEATAGLALCGVSLVPILLLGLAFSEGGYEPFAAGALWPELGGALAVAVLLPQGTLSPHACKTLRIGAGLYAIALLASYLLKTPMGGNAARLGELLGAPLLAGTLWQRRRLLIMLCPLLLYWQLATSVHDQISLAGDPTASASYYAPLRRELEQLSSGKPLRVEVPLTTSHWEAAYLPRGNISIARGWERQLDVRYGALFYEKRLTAAAYRDWLHSDAISYVALPNGHIDSAGQAEARLIRQGLPYLRQAWHTGDWKLYEVRDQTPLVQRPATLLSLSSDTFAIQAPRSGSYEVRLRWTPYWKPSSPDACVEQAPHGYIEVQAHAAGRISVEISFSLDRIFSQGPRCSADATP